MLIHRFRETAQPPAGPQPLTACRLFLPGLCVLLLLGAQLFYPNLWPSAPFLYPDSYQYLQTAHSLSQRRWSEIAQRTPGYPLFLLLIRQTEPSPIVFRIQILLHFAAVYAAANLLRRMKVRPALIAAFCIVMSLPPYLQSASHLLTESLAELTLAVGLCFFGKYHLDRSACSFWLSAISFSYSGFVRPANALILPVAITVSTVASRLVLGRGVSVTPGALSTSVGAAALPVLALFAYSGLNWYYHGVFTPTTLAGFHLSTRVVHFLHLVPEDKIAEILVKHRDDALARQKNHYWAAYYAEPELLPLVGGDRAELSKRLAALSARLIWEFPVEYLRTVGEAFVHLVTPFLTRANIVEVFSPVFVKLWVILHFVLLIGFVLAGAVALAISVLGAANRAVIEGIVGSVSSAQVAIVSFAIAAVITVAVFSCALDIGEPRQRSFADLVAWFVCLCFVDGWLRLRSVGRYSYGNKESSVG